MKTIGLILTALLLFSSCVKRTSRVDNDNLENVFAPIFDFEYATIKGKLELDRNSDKQSANIDIRILRDSIIWASVRKVGVEPFRAMATPDSVYLIDRFGKKMVIYDMESFRLKSGLDLSLSEVQDVLFGRSPFINSPKRKILYQEDYVEVRTKVGKTKVTHRIPQASFLIDKIQVEAPTTEATLSFGNYQEIENTFIPFLFKGLLSAQEGAKITKLELEYSDVEFDEEELSFPFKVSSKYEYVYPQILEGN